MNTRKLISIIMGALVVLAGCDTSVFSDNVVRASGQIVEDSLTLDPFTEVWIEGPVEVAVVVDGTHGAAIRMDRELERRATIEVADGRFRLDFPDRMSVRESMVSEVTLHVARLDTVRVRGAARLSFDAMVGDDVHIDLSGASRVEGAAIDAARLRVDVSGASELLARAVVVPGEVAVDASGASRVRLEGTGGVGLVVRASGASLVDTAALPVTDADVDVSGASTVDLLADGTVVGDLSGASRLRLDGDAGFDVDTSGASTVNHR